MSQILTLFLWYLCCFLGDHVTLGRTEMKDLTGVLIWGLRCRVRANMCSSYWRIVPSFRCSSLSSFPWAWVNKCGLAWNPWGNSVQVYYCIWLKWGLVHSKANRYWDRKEGTLEVKHRKLFSISHPVLQELATRGMYRYHSIIYCSKVMYNSIFLIWLSNWQNSGIPGDWQGTKRPCFKNLSMRGCKPVFASNFMGHCLLLG